MTTFLAILGGLASAATIFKGGQWFLQRFFPKQTPEQAKEKIDAGVDQAEKETEQKGRP